MVYQPYPADVEADTDGQRPCARGEHCAARTTKVEHGDRVTVPAATYRTFCDTDQNMIRDCLEDLPDRYRQLGDRIGDKGSATGLRVSSGGQHGSPVLNLGIEAFQCQIVEVVVSWEERVRDVAGLTDVDGPRRPDAAVTAACTVLAARVDVLLSLEPADMYRTVDIAHAETLPHDATGWVHPNAGWIGYNTQLGGVNAGIEVLNLHHRALHRLGLTPQHQDLISRCWQCGERGLRRHDGTAGLADHVECLRCRDQYLGSRLASLMVEEDTAQQRRRAREHRPDGTAGEEIHSGRSGYGGRP